VKPLPLTVQLPPLDGQLMEMVVVATNAGEADTAKAAIPLNRRTGERQPQAVSGWMIGKARWSHPEVSQAEAIADDFG
jgi:hypothetical protein